MSLQQCDIIVEQRPGSSSENCLYKRNGVPGAEPYGRPMSAVIVLFFCSTGSLVIVFNLKL
jgi:hypothetical protein